MKSWLSRWIFSGGDAMAAVGLGRFAYVFPTKGKQMLSKAADLAKPGGVHPVHPLEQEVSWFGYRIVKVTDGHDLAHHHDLEIAHVKTPPFDILE